MAKRYTTSIAVPADRADAAKQALTEAGYEVRSADQAPRDEHPSHVVLATARVLKDKDGQAGHRNIDEAHEALRDALIPFHHYGHGAVVAGGPGHRWVEMRGSGGQRLGIKALAQTEAFERAVGRIAIAGNELEELTADMVQLLALVNPAVGSVRTDRKSHAALIRQVRELAKVQLDEGLAADVLEWLAEVDQARNVRNELVHSTVTFTLDLPASRRDLPSINGPALVRRRVPSPRPLDPDAWDDLVRRTVALRRRGDELYRRVGAAVPGHGSDDGT